MTISTTAGTLGFATAVADVIAWKYGGSPLPIPEDVIASFAVIVGVGTHALGIAITYAVTILDVIVQKRFGISINPPLAKD